MRLFDYDYALPEGLIAARPLLRREDSRMMVIHRDSGRIEHRRFADFEEYIREDDLVVLNDTRVIPARVFSDDGRVELLFLEPRSERSWRCMVKPGRRMRLGASVTVGGVGGSVTEMHGDGTRQVEFSAPVDLDAVGRIPLPPYIEREVEEADAERYQTVYAAVPGAVAAPTAGLHFTPGLLARLCHAFVTLHVGAGTFRPVQVENVDEHQMHEERYAVPASTAEAIRDAGRVVAIGTTTVRVLESVAAENGGVVEGEGRTAIFIRPPYEFRVTGALLTNFHLPRSTLLMLVAAFAGRELVLAAYREAVAREYRFYSYGDCMLLL